MEQQHGDLIEVSYERIMRRRSMIESYVRQKRRRLMTDLTSGLREGTKEWPLDIIELIFKRLGVADYIRSGAVCSAWRSLFTRAMAEKEPAPASQLPWLMICALNNLCFINPNENNKVYQTNPLHLNPRQIFVGSIEGWFIAVDYKQRFPQEVLRRPWPRSLPAMVAVVNNYFLNPLTGARVMLPSQATIQLQNSASPAFFRKVVASSVPNSPDCFVVAITTKSEIAYCKPTDQKWTVITPGKAWIEDIELSQDGMLYAVSPLAKVLSVYNLREGGGWKKLTMLHSDAKVKHFTFNLKAINGIETRLCGHTVFLVKASISDKLYLVLQNASVENGSPRTIGFQVFELDRSRNSPKWKEVVSLDNQIVFVGSSGSKLISVTDDETLRGNCIYFAFDYNAASTSSGRDVGVFNLADKRIKYHDLTHAQRPSYALAPIWFTPCLW